MKKLVYSLSAILVLAGALSAATTKVTGTLKKEAGKFVMVDDATHTSFEIRGTGLEKFVGSHVAVTGELINGVAGVGPIVEMTSATKVAAVAGKAAAAGVKAGIAKSTVLAAGAVATGGVVGTLYATDVIGGEEEPASRR